jgi:hypothetical protein
VDANRDALWSELRGLAIDPPGAALRFTARLARENGWSAAFAEAVTLEYRRFLLLAATAGHPVTPSDAVDQAWHLHLTYTESYWNDLCARVLGRPLHHGPTRGGDAEDAKFVDWYESTLRSYRAVFGTAPPAAIWPPSAERFANAAAFRRVDTSRSWVVPRAVVRSLLVRAPAAAAVTALLAGCALWSGLDGRWRAFAWVIGGFVAFFAFCIWLMVLAERTTGGVVERGGDGRAGWSGCGDGGSLGGGGSHHGSGCGSSGDGGSGCGSSGCGGGGCGGGGCGGS